MLEFLRKAAAVSTGAAIKGLPDGVLRFSLVTRGKADERALCAEIDALLDGKFVLRPIPGADDDQALLLEFPGVRREQSSAFLFAVAQALAEKLDLQSVEPDVEADFVAGDEMMRDMPESVGGLVRLFCESKAKKPEKIRWSLENVRAPEAWEAFATTGENVLIGQPDTGVATHNELEDALRLDLGTDVIAGGGPPVDPLDRSMGNPGHGTATASCVVGTAAGSIAGVAPAAALVPIRCINSVVIGAGVNVAAAIDHARTNGCRIVTMSLGGLIEGAALKRAIKRAVDADMIVLAAAGNCVEMVIYPAWDENVIAVAAVDEHDRRWTGSSHGPKVDFAAPGENVYVASRKRDDDVDLSVISPGQGTSFAVATAAGCAALWLARHGEQPVKARANELGVSVNALFRAAARQSARRVANWQGGMGAGVIDAYELLALELARIDPRGARSFEAHPARALVTGDFDWPRHGAELGALVSDRALRNDPVRNAMLESTVAPEPSPQLRKALAASAGGGARVVPAAPAVLPPITPELSPTAAFKRIVAGAGAAGPEALEAVRRSLAGDAGRSLKVKLEARLESLDAGNDRDPGVARDRKRILHHADRAIASLAGGTPLSRLGALERASTEALILLTGRPSLQTINGRIDIDDPELGEFVADIAPRQDDIKRLIDAVGRIDREVDGEWVHVGTGSVIADGLILTNRHVMEAVAEPTPSAGGRQEFELVRRVSISFDDAPAVASKRFEITGVAAAGPRRIGRYADVSKLDMALLTFRSQGAPAPVPLCVLNDSAPPSLLIVGYPAQPAFGAGIDPQTGLTSPDIWRRLNEIYQREFGVKYASPGKLEARLGVLDRDSQRWGFGHDATTLGGNSGSPVFALDGVRACGLHFGGAPLRRNYAHGLAAARDADVQASGIPRKLFDAMEWEE